MTLGSPWYAEMHAYALGAAAEGVRHAASNSTVFHVAYYHPHGGVAASKTPAMPQTCLVMSCAAAAPCR